MGFSLSDESKNITYFPTLLHRTETNNIKKERITRVLESARVVAHYGWIPFVLYLGWVQTPNRPPLLALLSPLPSV
ncbi:Mitochondrial import receptor subunit TOM7 [Cyberlindnera fabianii]|uniref:Mitochondrial import receptor subunit TOM7 n=1 Tax=Cyberlindnera fabianii TaxID=36022 RepID=A0A1V2LBJ1_CYBFA|nr:Mitochondrial import receptor subunit TOM7 [Cyberlindnera fabianii]